MSTKPHSKTLLRNAMLGGAGLATLIGGLFLAGVFGPGQEIVGYCMIAVGVADAAIAMLVIKD
jgi:hypothetical protein